MQRASTVLRRSGVKLKSLSGGHEELQMVISQITTVKDTFKAFMEAQEILYQDIHKWVNRLENNALKEAAVYLTDLSSLWADIQSSFYDTCKKFRSDFQMLHEDEKQVDQARKKLEGAEKDEISSKKSFDKLLKTKSTADQRDTAKALHIKLERAKYVALTEYNEKVKENEAVRLIRVKEGLRKLGTSYLEMATKETAIFQAHKQITEEIPDGNGRQLQDIQFRGSQCIAYIQKAKDQIRSYHDRRISLPNPGERVPPMHRSQSCRFNRNCRHPSEPNSPGAASYPGLPETSGDDEELDDPPPPYNPYYECTT